MSNKENTAEAKEYTGTALEIKTQYCNDLLEQTASLQSKLERYEKALNNIVAYEDEAAYSFNTASNALKAE